MKDLSTISVVLPSLDPDEKLHLVIDGLLDYGFTDIILVTDGTKPQNLHYFEDEAAAHPDVIHLLHHEVNKGKGAALKNASGKELFRILLGKGHFLRPEEGTTQRGNAEGRYVLVNGKVYLIPLVFEECHPVPSAWVEALQLKDLQKSLLMTDWKIPANQTKAQILFQVFRRSTAHPFTLLQPRDKGTQADNAILSGIAAELSKPFTGDYFTGNVNALAGKESVFLLIRTSDGFQYRLQVIEHNAQTDVVSLAVQYDPAKVLPVPGESPQNLAERKKILAKRFEE